MKLLIAIFLVTFSTLSFAQSIHFRSAEGIDIHYSATVTQFTPYDWKWSSLKMVHSDYIRISGGNLRGDEDVRVVLINRSLGNVPFYWENKIQEIDLDWYHGSFQYGRTDMRVGEKETPYLKVSGYWNANFTYEIAIVINGHWLVDPYTGLHNFPIRF